MSEKTSEAGDQARIRAEALSVLRDALAWRLTPAAWSDLAGILSELDAHGPLDLADPVRLRALDDATAQLEFAGPARIESVDSAAEPAPPEIRERLNLLIDQLSGGSEEGSAPGGR